MKFIPHGGMTVDWIENCLVMEFTGSVNIEGAMRFKEQIEQSVYQSDVEHWFGIHQSTDNTMSTPEAYMILENALLWSLDNGCIGTVLIGGTMIIKNKFSELCHKTGMPFYCFAEQNQALEFCRALTKK